ncbi:MAG: GNAT family N-acetyltransferase [Acholeplasmatales bacterium]|jgi:RimJ/RimL family protein N-acetyltransferase|nr:GNAT family N-acetyltransferase [Acholeplasmatales bacterium]
MRLINKEILIRTSEKSDSAYLFKWWNDLNFSHNIGFTKNELTISNIESIIDNFNNEASGILIIEISNHIIGELNYSITNNIANIGITIGELTFQNKGYGNRILKIFIKYLFTSFDKEIDTITLEAKKDNLIANHLYQKLGFIISKSPLNCNLEDDTFYYYLPKENF